MLVEVLLLALFASTTSSEDCKCNDASKAWGGVAYHCSRCTSVPQTLPNGLTFLGLDEYLGMNLTSYDLRHYKDTLEEVRVDISKKTRGNIGSHAFQGLKKLTALYLVGNDMKHFPHLPHSTEVVEMQENQIQALPDMYLPNLQELMLDTNRIQQLPGIFIAEKLTALSLYDNQLTSANLRQLPGLRIVDLGVNRLQSFPELPKSVAVAKLQFNQISTIPKLDLPNLTHLDLSNNNITHIMNGTFRGCPKLMLVKLNGNPIKYIAPSEKARLRRLRECDLPKGVTLDIKSRVSWVWMSVIGLAVVACFIAMVYFLSSRISRRRGYVRPHKVWHVNLRTPIYRGKRNEGTVYKQLVSEAF